MMECAPTDNVIEEIIASQADNLDTARALSTVKSWVIKCEAGSTGGSAGELSRALDSLLGLAI
jgi:L-cysteine:1D-myo-inositol 2-amino-2-deoxy-alpha-D-glucopyranoside ligase